MYKTPFTLNNTYWHLPYIILWFLILGCKSYLQINLVYISWINVLDSWKRTTHIYGYLTYYATMLIMDKCQTLLGKSQTYIWPYILLVFYTPGREPHKYTEMYVSYSWQRTTAIYQYKCHGWISYTPGQEPEKYTTIHVMNGFCILLGENHRNIPVPMRWLFFYTPGSELQK